MIELQSESSFYKLKCSKNAIVLFAPEWSIYSKKSVRIIQELEKRLSEDDIQVFILVKDDPSENIHFSRWWKPHAQVFRGVGVGSGEVLFCRMGVPYHVEFATHDNTKESLLELIFLSIGSQG